MPIQHPNYFPGNNEFGSVRMFAPEKYQSFKTSNNLFLDNSQTLRFFILSILMPKAKCATELAGGVLESC